MWTNTSISKHASAVLFVALLAPSLVPAHASDQDCLPIRQVEGYVVGLDYDGQDLLITLEWRDDAQVPEAAVAEVRDLQNNLITNQVIQPRAGEKTIEVLPAVLADLQAHGVVYRIEVEGDLIEPHEIRVGLDCPPDQACTYLLTGPVSTQALVFGAGLGEALAEVPKGSGDVLGDILSQSPLLLGPVADLALQLANFDQRFGIPTGTCTCLWESRVFDGDDETLTANSASNSPGIWLEPGQGASLSQVKEVYNKTYDVSVSGQTSLTMDMHCWSFLGWSRKGLEVRLPGSKEVISLRKPILKSCDAPCSGQLVHQVRYEGRILAVARGYFGESLEASPVNTVADVVDGIEYRVDDQLILRHGSSAQAQASTGVRRTDLNTRCWSNLHQGAVPSTASITAWGSMDLAADGDNISCSCAAGGFANAYTISATATASCAVPTEAEATVNGSLGYSIRNPPLSDSDDEASLNSRPRIEILKNGRVGVIKEPWCP